MDVFGVLASEIEDRFPRFRVVHVAPSKYFIQYVGFYGAIDGVFWTVATISVGRFSSFSFLWYGIDGPRAPFPEVVTYYDLASPDCLGGLIAELESLWLECEQQRQTHQHDLEGPLRD
jgi:hypothetical protein